MKQAVIPFGMLLAKVLRLVCALRMLKAFSLLLLTLPLAAREMPAELSAYALDPAPAPAGLMLKKGDRLAICGDSITEQKQYSLIIESYLTACMPEMEITCRQYGWSGEQASGFLKRVEGDVLRFKPTIATTCYGMNDFRYVPKDDAIAAEYRDNLTAAARIFKDSGCRLIIGSSGIIDSVPHWVKTARGTQQELNHALANFRNIALGVAMAEQVGFADVYQPMLLADHDAKRKFGADFKVAGKDGVHPGWAGQVIMARAFLTAMGVSGDIGTIIWDAATDKATASDGHEIRACSGGRLSLRSTRLPFSPGPGDATRDDSIRAGLALVPFDDELNRFILKITTPKAAAYTITWGDVSKRLTAAELQAGVSLAKMFDNHPLTPAFQEIWNAVAAKQAYETRQIKQLAHGPEGKAEPDDTFALTEKVRAPLAAAIRAAIKPADHEIIITPAE
jgi:lysophospholipase L1-like esterase